MGKPLAIIGIIGGVLWMVVAMFLYDGSSEPRGHDPLLNRLATLAYAAMSFSFLALLRRLTLLERLALIPWLVGFLLMTVGGLLEEFPPYNQTMIFGFGAVLVPFGGLIFGLVAAYGKSVPWWVVSLFFLSAPMMMLGSLLQIGLLALPLGLLGCAVGWLCLRPRATGLLRP